MRESELLLSFDNQMSAGNRALQAKFWKIKRKLFHKTSVIFCACFIGVESRALPGCVRDPANGLKGELQIGLAHDLAKECHICIFFLLLTHLCHSETL
jgi:hypothetical protein